MGKGAFGPTATAVEPPSSQDSLADKFSPKAARGRSATMGADELPKKAVKIEPAEEAKSPAPEQTHIVPIDKRLEVLRQLGLMCARGSDFLP